MTLDGTRKQECVCVCEGKRRRRGEGQQITAGREWRMAFIVCPDAH